MNSKSSRSPSYLSSASYTSSPKVSSSLGSSRLYSGETDRVLNKDPFPRSSSAYQTDVGQPNSRLLGPSRDYRSPDSRSTSWNFSSTLTSSTSSRSTDRSWAGSPLSSRSKLPDSDWRLGIPSVRLNATDDTDSKKAKLSYSNRGLYSRTPFTSVKESNYSSIGLGRDQSDRLTSTYAQGARPKQPPPSYSSSSYSSTARDSSFNRHLPSSTSLRSPLERDYSSRISAHFLNDSSTRHSSQAQRRNPESSSNISSHYTSRTRFYTTPQARAESTLPIRKASEDREPEGHRYSRSTIQDSSSRSCRVSANGLDNEATGRKFVHRNECARVSRLQRDTGGSNATLGFLRNQEVLPLVQEDDQQGYSSGLAQSRRASWRDPEVDSNNDTSSEEGSSSSWLSSSRQPRNPPLLSRLRRHARDQSSRSAAGLEEEYNLSQDSWRRQDLHGKKASQEEDDDEEEGAVGVEAPGVGLPRRPEVEMLPDLDVALVEPPLHQRDSGYESTPFSVCQLSRGEDQLDGHREKPITSLVEDNLRKIKERLLLEDSDEDEDHLCRICQMGEDRASNPLIQPCSCTGSLQHVHQECLKRWLRSKVDMGRNLSDVTKCELCKEKLQLNMNDFDIQDLYRTHVQSQCDEFFNSGLYPVALFQLGDDFSDVLGALDGNVLLNLVRILREDMDNLEIPHSESDEEVQDHRPSIDFSDLDDDLDLEF